MSVSEPACDYCGLPVKRSAGRLAGKSEGVYCCFGCSLAAAVAGRGGAEGAANWMLARLFLAVFLTLNVVVFSMALWTQDVYDVSPDDRQLNYVLYEVFRYLALLLSLPVAWLLGGPVAKNAWNNLRQGNHSTDLLLLTGVAAAFVYSAVSVFRGVGHVYFEVGCVVLVLFTLGRWLEATGKLRTTAALDSLQKLLPQTARVIRDGIATIRPLETIEPGDHLRVLAGERIAADGRIVQGVAAVDQQIMTGESQPVVKEPGDDVWGGSLNLDGDLIIATSARPDAGVLGRMMRMVAEARLAKGYYQRLADRVSAVFIPAVTVLALAAFAWHAAHRGIEQGLLAGLAVALIACPCALGLATPMAVWAAIGHAARHGVLFYHGDALERLAFARTIYFDKTGTLTTGEAHVVAFHADVADRQTVMQHSACLAAGSNHPLSLALARWIAQPCDRLPLELQTLPGRGLRATLSGVEHPIYLGSVRLMREAGLQLSPRLSAAIAAADRAGQAIACVGWHGQIRGVFVLEESLRAGAAAAVERCRAMGLAAAVLTGDRAARARSLAEQVRVDVRGELLPDDKLAAVLASRSAARGVVMVGDGINDAPALAAADVGIAMGCGSDFSRASADVCLLSDDLGRVPWTVALARRTATVIRQNLFWAFFYNVVGVGLACAGWLNPIWAAVAMTASSLLVVGNSLRLGRDGV